MGEDWNGRPRWKSIAVSVRRDGTAVDWVNEVRGEFATTTFESVEGEAPEELETADQLRLSTELQLHRFTVASGVPVASVAYDTEFTPLEGNERRKRLEGAVGALWSLNAADGGKLSVRLATILARDFAAPVEDPELGFQGVLGVRKPLGPLVWLLDLEGRYYVPDIGEADPGALGVLVRGRTGLDVPLVGGLALSLFVDAFAFRGQTKDDFGVSLSSGAALKLDGLLKPGYR